MDMDSLQPPQTRSANETLYFMDDRVVDKSRYVCVDWSKAEAGTSMMPSGPELRNLEWMKLEDPSSGSDFFAGDYFPKLAKLDVTSVVFRQGELLTLPEEYITHLPSLQCLTVDMTFPSISWQAPVEEEVALNRNGGKNLQKFFTILDCPTLSSFHMKTSEDKYRHSNWEVEIFDFLKTKKQLNIVDLYFGNKLEKETRQSHPFIAGVYPLAPLEVLLIQYNADSHYEYNPSIMPNYWMPLLNQRNLVVIDLVGVPSISISDLHFLVRRNETTLEVLRFQYVFCHAQRCFKFDCDALKMCSTLREFDFNPGICNSRPRYPNSYMINTRRLPPNITSLTISNVNLPTSVMARFRNLKKLKFLRLFQCGASEGHGVTFDALLDLLRIPTLDKLIAAPILLADNEEEKKLAVIEEELKEIDPDFEFLRHYLNPPPPQRPENTSYVIRYCPIM